MGYNTNFRGCFRFSKQPSKELVEEINEFCSKRHDDIFDSSPWCPWVVCKDNPYRYKSLGVYLSSDEEEITEEKRNIKESYEYDRTYVNKEYTEQNKNDWVLKWDGSEHAYNWLYYLKYISKNFLSKEDIKLTGLIEYQGQMGLIIGEKTGYIDYYDDVYKTIRKYFAKVRDEWSEEDEENAKETAKSLEESEGEISNFFRLLIDLEKYEWLSKEEIVKKWQENEEFFKSLTKMFEDKYKNNMGFVWDNVFQDPDDLYSLIHSYQSDEDSGSFYINMILNGISTYMNSCEECDKVEDCDKCEYFENYNLCCWDEVENIGVDELNPNGLDLRNIEWNFWKNMWENDVSRKWLKFLWCLDNGRVWSLNNDEEKVEKVIDEFEDDYESLGIQYNKNDEDVGCDTECEKMVCGKCGYFDEIMMALWRRYRGHCGFVALNEWMVRESWDYVGDKNNVDNEVNFKVDSEGYMCEDRCEDTVGECKGIMTVYGVGDKIGMFW